MDRSFSIGTSGPELARVGEYRLLRRIGCGSYGEVWLARDAAGHYRALKVVYRKTFDQDRPYEREYSGIQKFEPVSRLHASQVAILQVGRVEAEGFFYYAMELADPAGVDDGRTLDTANVREDSEEILSYYPKTLKSEIRRHGRYAYDEALRIGIALATALDHLHRHGLVHRDIKPSNVIFVGGVPKLADIGLVTDMGATISCVGTEGFIPPEGPGTPLADIYGLGKVIYEMATGLDRLEFPELPPSAGNEVERERLLELNLIFLKACQVDPLKRYRSVREMLADLALLHGGRSLRRARLLEQRIRRVKRGLAAVLVLGGLGAAGWGYWDYQRGLRFRARMEEIGRREEFARRVAGDLTARLAESYLRASEAALQSGDQAQALLWTAHAWAEGGGEKAADQSRALLASLTEALPWPAQLASLGAPGRRVFGGGSANGCVFLDDAGRLSWMEAGTNGKPAEITRVGTPILQMVLDRAARSWFLLNSSGTVMRLDRLTGRLQPMSRLGPVTNLSQDGLDVAVVGATTRGEVVAWDIHNATERFRWSLDGEVSGVECSPDGKWIAVRGPAASVKLLDVDKGGAISSQLNHPEPVEGLCFSGNSRRLITWGARRLQLWDVGSGEPSSVSRREEGGLRSVSFLPTDEAFVTVSREGEIRVRDAVTGEPAGPALGPFQGVQRVEFTADGSRLVVLAGGVLWMWECLPGGTLRPMARIAHGVVDFSLAPGAGWLWLSDSAGIVQQWDLLDSGSWREMTEVSDAKRLRAWAEVLSGMEMQKDRLVASAPPKRTADWDRRREIGWPQSRALGRAEQHRREAERREKREDWFGAAFHWHQAASDPSAAADAGGRTAVARSRWLASLARGGIGKPPAVTVPPRAVPVPAECIDLGAHYNGMLDQTWLPAEGLSVRNDLVDLGAGCHRLGGISFDIRGVIQLAGGALENQGRRFPRSVDGIAVNRRAARLHFLHATAWDAPHRTVVGVYRIHFADGKVVEWNMSFGENIREWWSASAAPKLYPSARVVWQGSNEASRRLGMSVRLFQAVWVNPRPEVEISSIDLASAMERPAPFLVAVSTDLQSVDRSEEGQRTQR